MKDLFEATKRALELREQAHAVRADARNARQRSQRARSISAALRRLRRAPLAR